MIDVLHHGILTFSEYISCLYHLKHVINAFKSRRAAILLEEGNRDGCNCLWLQATEDASKITYQQIRLTNDQTI